jgi:HPt (histidine-containing phosphotransfer) domain-containing protein
MASELAGIAAAQRIAEARKASRPVDLVHLSRYTLGERGLEREVLKLFATQAEVNIERLHEAATDQDWRDGVHALKGSARAIGAWRAAEAAERAEAISSTLSGKALSDARADAARDMEQAVREAQRYIFTLLKDTDTQAAG